MTTGEETTAAVCSVCGRNVSWIARDKECGAMKISDRKKCHIATWHVPSMTTGEEAGALAVAKRFAEENTATMKYCNWQIEALAALITREKNAAVEQERERCAKGWLPIALCPTDGVWRLTVLPDGSEVIACFDGVGLLAKKRWQTKTFLVHNPSQKKVDDYGREHHTAPYDTYVIADLKEGTYPTHFRPNDTVHGAAAIRATSPQDGKEG